MNKDVCVSKSLSWLLRHGAIKEGLHINSDGYIPVCDILKHNKFKNFSIEDIKRVVSSNDKQRFGTRLNSNGVLEIKANQGHSIQCVNDLELTEILNHSEIENCIHGTFFRNWNKIKAIGLSRMTRLHIHFAVGLPSNSNVISGMRHSSEVYIYIDIRKALSENLKFYKSANNVILCPGDQQGILGTQYFLKVVNSRTGELLIY